MAIRELVWVVFDHFHSAGDVHVSILNRSYYSSRNPYAWRWLTRILLSSPPKDAEQNHVFGYEVGANTIPMAIKQLGKLLVMFKAMPFKTGQIAPAPMLEDVPARMHPATAVARGFFDRCFRVMTRTFVSPKKRALRVWAGN